jgi:hypothetical protein
MHIQGPSFAMNMRTLLVATVLLFGVTSLPSSQLNSELADREYEVLSALCVRQMNQLDLACMMDDSTWTAPLSESVLAKIGRTSSLARDYIRKNQQAAPLHAERVAKAFHPKEGRRYPFPDQRFSRVGFSARADSALVQVLSGPQRQSYVLVKGQDDWWTVAHTFLRDTIYRS